MHLSSHFTLAEAERSMTAVRLGIDNSMPRLLVPNAIYHATEVLERIRVYFGIPFSPTSWYRCLELNRALGSSDSSAHVQGLAADVELPGVPNDELFWWCAHNLSYDQLIREYPKPGEPASGWVHIASAQAGERPRQERFSIPWDSKYVQ